MRHRDFIQNIAITLLAVSALFLFSRTQFFQLGAASVSNYWQRITAPASSATDDVILSDIPHRPPFWRLWEKLRSTAIFSPPCRRPIWRI